MRGISSKILGFGDPGNKFKYNGNEEQRREFSDGSGWEIYDFNARTYDAQTGRFIQIDPLSEDGGQVGLSTYQFGWNDPIKNSDPDGKCPTCLLGAAIGFVVDAAVQIGTSVAKSVANNEKPTFNTIWRDYNGYQGAAATGAGFVTGGISAYEQGGAAIVKTTLANASFSAVEQIRQNGSVDPVKTLIESFPAPEVKVKSLINTGPAEKMVRQAENSINSSTSTVPQRKYNRLNNAEKNLDRQSSINEGFEIFTISTIESVGKQSTKGVVQSKGIGSYGGISMEPYDTRPSADNTRVAKPYIPPIKP